ncbi:hypothetical protein DTO207G8_4241 [Paecilomyces variotii]|nr:hypothetical protein DTO169C6_6515 [Paecilomyces variotii]KAJ9253234.1 hypothetical protein DTO207G8_4241 [Paecilomyces variotii]
MDQLLDVGRCEPELASAGGRQHNSRVQGDRERVEQHDPSVSARFESRDSDHHREPPFAVLIWNAADLLFHHGRYRWYTCHHGSSCLPPTTRAVESKPESVYHRPTVAPGQRCMCRKVTTTPMPNDEPTKDLKAQPSSQEYSWAVASPRRAGW